MPPTGWRSGAMDTSSHGSPPLRTRSTVAPTGRGSSLRVSGGALVASAHGDGEERSADDGVGPPGRAHPGAWYATPLDSDTPIALTPRSSGNWSGRPRAMPSARRSSSRAPTTCSEPASSYRSPEVGSSGPPMAWSARTGLPPVAAMSQDAWIWPATASLGPVLAGALVLEGHGHQLLLDEIDLALLEVMDEPAGQSFGGIVTRAASVTTSRQATSWPHGSRGWSGVARREPTSRTRSCPNRSRPPSRRPAIPSVRWPSGWDARHWRRSAPRSSPDESRPGVYRRVRPRRAGEGIGWSGGCRSPRRRGWGAVVSTGRSAGHGDPRSLRCATVGSRCMRRSRWRSGRRCRSAC